MIAVLVLNSLEQIFITNKTFIFKKEGNISPVLISEIKGFEYDDDIKLELDKNRVLKIICAELCYEIRTCNSFFISTD